MDARLDALGRPELKSKAALANARLAYGLFQERFATARWKSLEAQGARLQRPLMASTGVKDPALPDTLYVTELVAQDLVNTMPEKTMMAVADHGLISGDTITPSLEDAISFMQQLSDAGVDFDDVTQKLEDEGVSKFITSWDELVGSVAAAIEGN